MRLGQTSAIYFVSKLVGSALGFLATIYFARELGEVVLGQYALVLVLVTWLGAAGKLGFSSAITKRISEGNDPEKFIGAGIVVMSVLISTMSLLVIIFRSQINAYVGAPIAGFVVLLLFVTLYKSFVNASLKGNHLVHVDAILSGTKQVVRAIIQILLVVVGFGLSGMLWGYAVAYIITATLGLWILGLRPAIPQKHHVVSLFNYAKFSWLGTMRSRTFDSVDIAVLGVFVTQGFVGIYSVAWSLSKFLDIFGSAISTTLFPEMSKISAEKSAHAAAGLTEDALTYGGLILIPGLVGAYFLGDRLMLIYGEAFVAGAEVLTLLIAALLIYTYNKQLLNTLNAIDRPNLAFRVNAVFIIINVILNFVLIWQIGWVGAAIATLVSASIGLVFAFYYTQKLVPFSIPYAEIMRQWVAALSMGLVIFIARRTTEANFTWLDSYNTAFIIVLVALGATVYFTILLGISTRFRTTIKNNLPFDIQLLN